MHNPQINDILILPSKKFHLNCCGSGETIKNYLDLGIRKIKITRFFDLTDYPHAFYFDYYDPNKKTWMKQSFWMCANHWPKQKIIFEGEVPYTCKNCLSNEWNMNENFICVYCNYIF